MTKFFTEIEEIKKFSGDYRFLSNFYPSPIKWNKKWWKTVEHAYQAEKFPDNEDLQEEIRSAKYPGRAKKIAWSCGNYREDWDDIKVEVMRKLLELKFEHPYFRDKLLETGDAYLEEGNTWGDTFWGTCNGRGKNMLGILLMEIREKLKGGD